MRKERSVYWEVEFTELENDKGKLVDGVMVTCGRCDHCVESYGTSPKSIRRCLYLLQEECPYGEENDYVVDDDYLEDS